MTRDWALFIGTDSGIFSATPTDGEQLTIEALGPSGKSARTALVDCQQPGRLYAGTAASGVLCTEDGGKSWRELNDGIRYKDIWALAQHPTTGTLWAGTEPAAIFRSDDHGETWEDCASLREMKETAHWTFPREPHFAHVKNITLVAENPDLVYAAIEEGWVVRSTDGGETWETLKQGVDHDAHAVTIMPDNPKVMFAATGAGLYRSDDGGERFVQSDDGIPRGFFGGGYMGHVAVHPDRPNVLFTCSTDGHPGIWFNRADGARGVLYRSDDQGHTWQPLTNGVPGPLRGAPVSTVIDPSDPDRVFWGTQDGTVWMSEDGGATIKKAAEGLPGWLAWLTVHHGPLTVAVTNGASATHQVNGVTLAERLGAEVGQEYDIEITQEIDNPFIGPNGTSHIGNVDLRIPNAKKGEKYRVKVLAIAINQYTHHHEATIQKV